MKSLFISTFVVILLITTWMFLYNFISQSTDEFNSLLNDMDKTIYSDNWASTQSIYTIINDKWINKQKVLLISVNHEEIEKVNLSLEKLKKYIYIKDKALTLGETAALKFLLNHIKEKESLSLKNIF
ncbi:DUF4363 family protein [Wukongibacter baidiensis]|uniref:DUF4363 family protein n=1 Tax=Wukongibacter baidiensis TaxID=1723361 RepID=UPI003D7F4B53